MNALGTVALFVLFFSTSSHQALPLAAADSDRDGIPDELEQDLLVRFMPLWMISGADCDLLPAEFVPSLSEPRVLVRNGTIYGQVFKIERPGVQGAHLELHYYHLWSRDCGRVGHEFDAEHVSTLVAAPALGRTASDWKALLWYAASHEDTACDSSSGANAAFLGADMRGPRVWISNGKHASFFREDRCRGGCGSDRCDEMFQFTPPKLVNIGEPGSPMNGAAWTSSSRWPLAEKMGSDFSVEVVARLERSAGDGIVDLGSSAATTPVKAVAMAGGKSADALGTGRREAGSALETGDERGRRAAGGGLKQAGRSLKKAARAVGGFLGIETSKPEASGKPPS